MGTQKFSHGPAVRRYAAGLVASVLAAAALVGMSMAPAAATATSGTFTNASALSPADNAVVSSSVTVSGMNLLLDASVILKSLHHTWPADLDIMLQGPTGKRVMLMSDAPNGLPYCKTAVTNLDLKFAGGTSPTIPDNQTLADTGYYSATNNDAIATGCGTTTGDSLVPTPTDASLDAFKGTDPNGVWTLYVADDGTGDAGGLAAGWSLSLAGELWHVNPTSIDFGTTAVNGTTDASVTITNVAGFDLPSTTLSLPSPAPFSRVSDDCVRAHFAAGASCTLVVRFHPTATGVQNRVLTLTMGYYNVVIGITLTESHTITVVGTGLTPQQQPPMPTACLGKPATITGTPGNDTLVGTGGNDVIVAGPGDDTVKGAKGNDVVCGGDGNDTIKGAAGNDKLLGEAGDDVLKGGVGRDRCDGGVGTDIAKTCEKKVAVP